MRLPLPYSRRKAETSSEWGEPNTAGVSIPSELSFDEISHFIDEKMILENISVTAPSGTVTCLLGPSGSGKTTLLRIAAGMLQQSTGSVLLDGQEIGGPSVHLPPEKRGIGLVFQDYALFPHMTISRNVLFGLHRIPGPDRMRIVEAMLQRVGMADRMDAYPHELSGGEQQRVALARAMAPRPGVLLMDEPFSGLDSRLRDRVREETLGVLKETRATAIIVTHDPEEALKLGDQIVLLNRGRLEQVGTGRELFYEPRSLFATAFFSEINMCQGVVRDGHLNSPLGLIPVKNSPDGTNATAAIRPNAFKIYPAKKGKSGAKTITGRILSSHFMGVDVLLLVGVNGLETPLRIKVPANVLPQAQMSPGVDLELVPQNEGIFAFASD